jgi:hypothetical protein
MPLESERFTMSRSQPIGIAADLLFLYFPAVRMPRSVRVASVVSECAWPARRRFWIMSHQVQLSPAASQATTAGPEKGLCSHGAVGVVSSEAVAPGGGKAPACGRRDRDSVLRQSSRATPLRGGYERTWLPGACRGQP